MLSPEYIIRKWCGIFGANPEEEAGLWDVWFRHGGWHNPEIVKRVNLATALHNAEVQIKGLCNEVTEQKGVVMRKDAEIASMRERYKEDMAVLRSERDTERRMREECQEKLMEAMRNQHYADEVLAQAEFKEELNLKKEAEIEKSVELVRQFGLNMHDDDVTVKGVIAHLRDASAVFWGNSKEAMVRAFVRFAVKHLGNGWKEDGFWRFWEELFRNELFQNAMCECNLKAKYNLKLIVNILSWLRNKGAIALSQSELDKKLECPSTKAMYLANYKSKNPAYSSLTDELQVVVGRAFDNSMVE